MKEIGEKDCSINFGDNKYKVTYGGTEEDGLTITNKLEQKLSPLTPLNPPQTDVKVTKIWQGKYGKEIVAPVDTIDIELYRDKKATGETLELNKENNWTAEFKNLDMQEKLDSKKAYEYTVKEVGEENGVIKLSGKSFKVTYEGSMKDGFEITNKELEKKTPKIEEHGKDKMNPNTGDSFNGYLYISVIFLSFGMLALLEIHRRKKNNIE